MLGKTNSGKTWATLVPEQLVSAVAARTVSVIVAPSGMGKTAELRAHAARLCAAGIAGFFMPAADAMALGAATASRETARFEKWRTSSDRGVFFIDAVDELRFEGGNLGRLLLRLEQDAGLANRSQLHLVLSSRNEVWSVDDQWEVVRALSLPMPNPPVAVFALEPLYSEDVEAYAKARGVTNLSAFMNAFVEDELEALVDLRPPDVQMLVDYWRAHGKFGTWSQMLDASLEASLREESRQRADLQLLTPDEARRALKRVAAACVLSKAKKPKQVKKGEARVTRPARGTAGATRRNRTNPKTSSNGSR
jgi:hypothetical protein